MCGAVPDVGMGHAMNIGRLAPEVHREPFSSFFRHSIIDGLNIDRETCNTMPEEYNWRHAVEGGMPKQPRRQKLVLHRSQYDRQRLRKVIAFAQAAAASCSTAGRQLSMASSVIRSV